MRLPDYYDEPDVYVLCEQQDGRFRIKCGHDDLHAVFDTRPLAERRIDELIRDRGGRRAGWDFVRPWQGQCPNCHTKGSVIIARSEGYIIHQCGEPSWRCAYERRIRVV